MCVSKILCGSKESNNPKHHWSWHGNGSSYCTVPFHVPKSNRCWRKSSWFLKISLASPRSAQMAPCYLSCISFNMNISSIWECWPVSVICWGIQLCPGPQSSSWHCSISALCVWGVAHTLLLINTLVAVFISTPPITPTDFKGFAPV